MKRAITQGRCVCQGVRAISTASLQHLYSVSGARAARTAVGSDDDEEVTICPWTRRWREIKTFDFWVRNDAIALALEVPDGTRHGQSNTPACPDPSWAAIGAAARDLSTRGFDACLLEREIRFVVVTQIRGDEPTFDARALDCTGVTAVAWARQRARVQRETAFVV